MKSYKKDKINIKNKTKKYVKLVKILYRWYFKPKI